MFLSSGRMRTEWDSAFSRIALFFFIAVALFFCTTSPAFAASGGTCPTGANYLNAATNTLVTLSSIGVNSCYYVAANGSDSNSGTSETSPWLHAPLMPNCAASCATAQSALNGTAAAGVGIIFRGGDTWHFGNSSAAPYSGGTWEFNPSTGSQPNGTSSNPFYVGVDQSWYSGSSWARPILTGDNPVCGPTNAGSGCTSNPSGTCYSGSSSCTGLYYVSSCPYQVSGNNYIVDMTYRQYYVFDNFEMTGLCSNKLGQPEGDVYIRYGSAQAPLSFQNLYIHGWSHLAFQATNGSDCTGKACFNILAFKGSVNNGTVGESIHNNVVDGSDSDPIGAGICQGGFYDVAYNVFRYTSQCIPSTAHLFHDNLYEYFYENGHSNMLEDVGESSPVNAFYNNIFRHVENTCSSGCGVGLDLTPAVGTTDYFFNNLYYDEGAIEQFIVGQNHANVGTYELFNNTIEFTGSGNNISCSATGNSGAVNSANNHFITNNSGGAYASSCSAAPLSQKTDLIMSHATATTDGYTSSEAFVYSPSSNNLPTVSAGTNENASNGALCSALSSSGLSAAAAACQSDTAYGCNYNSSGHSVSCPARPTNARPATAAWDIGAYLYGSSVAPPSGLVATAN